MEHNSSIKYPSEYQSVSELVKMHIQLVALILSTAIIDQLNSLSNWDGPIFKTRFREYRTRYKLSSPTPPENYCRKDLCPENVKHIACNNPFWGPECTKPRTGMNMDKYKTQIVDLHNNYRSQLSVLGLGNLPLAKGLPNLQWDQELSVLAMRITNFCNDKNASECVNTPRFPNVAQNTFIHETTNSTKKYSAEEFLFIAIKYWGDYYQCFAPSGVASFPSDASNEAYEFANMINQNVHSVGCGMLTRKPGLYLRHYVTCLYNNRIKPGQKVYD